MRTPAYLMLIALLLTDAGFLSAQAPDVKGIEFFETRIRPVLVEQCYKCHSEEARTNKKLKAKLLLDTKAGMLKGGLSGPTFVAGKPGESLLMKVLRHEGEITMPPSGKLPPAVLSDFETWIKLGAPDPREGKQTAVAASASTSS